MEWRVNYYYFLFILFHFSFYNLQLSQSEKINNWASGLLAALSKTGKSIVQSVKITGLNKKISN